MEIKFTIDLVDIVLITLFILCVVGIVMEITWLSRTTGGILLFFAAYPYIRKLYT